MTYLIHRSEQADAVIFTLSGELDALHAARLQELLTREAPSTAGHILLDLKEVTVVDRDGVRFLARALALGVRIENCPRYVRRWMAAEPGNS